MLFYISIYYHNKYLLSPVKPEKVESAQVVSAMWEKVDTPVPLKWKDFHLKHKLRKKVTNE